MKKQKSLSISSLRNKTIRQSTPPSTESNLIKVQKFQKQKINKQDLKPNNIKQMYQYKIKNRMTKATKICQKSIHQKHFQQKSNLFAQQRESKQMKEIQALKTKIKQLLMQNINLKNQNQKLNKTIHKLDSKLNCLKNSQSIEQNNLKKQIINKLRNKQKTKMKTQPIQNQNYLNSSSKVHFSNTLNRKMSVKQIDKEIALDNNKFTMNLNMSFVNLDFDKNKRNSQQKRKLQQKKSSSSKSNGNIFQNQHHFKEHKIISKNQKKQSQSQNQQRKQQKYKSMTQIFQYFQKLQQIKLNDLKQFQKLVNKIFQQFEKLYSKCKQLYTQILQKVNPKIYISSRSSLEDLKARLSYKSQIGMYDYLMKTAINKISQFFKPENNVNNIFLEKDKSKSKMSLKKQTSNQKNQVEKRFDINDLKSLQSSVCSFQIDANPQKVKPVSKYHMQRLNQNLNVFMNFQNKKNQKQQNNQLRKKFPPKQMLQTYFSKPVSSDISKKVSKNGSLNVSLGDDK